MLRFILARMIYFLTYKRSSQAPQHWSTVCSQHSRRALRSWSKTNNSTDTSLFYICLRKKHVEATTCCKQVTEGPGEPTLNHTSESAPFHHRLLLNCYKETANSKSNTHAGYTRARVHKAQFTLKYFLWIHGKIAIKYWYLVMWFDCILFDCIDYALLPNTKTSIRSFK